MLINFYDSVINSNQVLNFEDNVYRLLPTDGGIHFKKLSAKFTTTFMTPGRGHVNRCAIFQLCTSATPTAYAKCRVLTELDMLHRGEVAMFHKKGRNGCSLWKPTINVTGPFAVVRIFDRVQLVMLTKRLSVSFRD